MNFFLTQIKKKNFMKGDAAPSESMEIADADADDADADVDADFDQTGDDVTWTVWC
jgi:hypothetical protein